MLIKNAFNILSEANLKIASLGVDVVDQENSPKQPKTIQKLIRLRQLYNLVNEFIYINSDDDGINGTFGQDDEAINELLLKLKVEANVSSFPVIPNPIHSFVTTNSSVGFGLPVDASQGDVLYFNNGSWSSLARGNDGDVLVSTSTTIQWQSVVGNGIPSGGTTGQVLKKDSNTSYDVVWSTLTPTDIGVSATAAELNKLSGALWSTAESNTLVGINTGLTIQNQINAKLGVTLNQGHFFVGNTSNEAEAHTPTGEVTFDHLGAFTISDDVIVNANINSSAAIARSKIATGNSNRVVINSSAGVMTDANAITPSRVLISDANGIPTHSTVTTTTLSYLDATSSIQGQLNNRLTVSLTSPTEGDVIYYNGTNWVNLGIGSNGQVLSSNGTTVQWANSTANGIPAGGSTNQYLRKIDGTDYNAEWHTLVLADITNVSVPYNEINLLSGLTVTADKLNFSSNVTSDIQAQIDTKLSNVLTHHSILVGGSSDTAQQLSAGINGSVLTIVSGHPTWQTPPSPGNVSGPVSSTDNAIVRWSNTDGVTIQDSGILIDDSNNMAFPTGTAIRTGTTDTNTLLLQAYDVDGTAYTTFATLTAGNTPTMNLSTAVTIDSAYIYRAGGTDIPLADGGTGNSLSDPDDNRILFWNDTDGRVEWLTLGSNLSLSGSSPNITLNAAGGTGGHIIENNGTPLTERANLNFTNGLTAADNNPDTDVKLGGAFIENTLISGSNLYNLILNEITGFQVSGDNAEILLRNNLGGAIDLSGQTGAHQFQLGQSAGVVFNIGGDASGDMYYRNVSGKFTRLSIGTNGYVLTVSGGIPSWAAPSATYTDSDAQDAVGNIFVDSSTIDFTYIGNTSISGIVIDNSISNSKFRQSSGLSVVGRSTNSTGNVADITAGSDNTVLRRSGTSIGFGTIGITSMTMNTARVLGRTTASSGAVEEISLDQGLELLSGAARLGRDRATTGTTANVTGNRDIRVGVENTTSGSLRINADYFNSGTTYIDVIYDHTDNSGQLVFHNGGQVFIMSSGTGVGNRSTVFQDGSYGGIKYSIAGVPTQTNATDRTLVDRGYVLGAKTYAAKQTFVTTGASAASITLPHGSAPSSPVNGDVWTTSVSMFARINGVTVDLGSSVSDGNKGDVTVSSSGTVWTVNNFSKFNINHTSSPFPITSAHRNGIIYVDTSTSDVTIDLSTLASQHDVTIIRNVGTNSIILDPGLLTLNAIDDTCSVQWGNITVWSDGTAWHADGALGAYPSVSGTSGQVAYFDGDNSVTSEAGFEYNSSTNVLTVPSFVSTVNTGSNAFTSFINTDNTTGGLRMLLQTGGSGDVFMTFDISGGLGLPVWAMGVDNSASDTFKLEYNTNQLGAGTAALSIATTGAMSIRALVGSTATESPLTISRGGQAEQGAYIILGDFADDSLQTRTITTHGDGSSESLTLAPRGGVVNITDFAGGNNRVLTMGTIGFYSFNGGAATLESAIYGGGGTNNHPFLITGNGGDLGTNDGASVTIQGGDGYGVSGNGDGGSILIQSGQRRIAGTGDDGNITIDTLTGYLIIANIPTSSAGLPSGAVWSNSNVLTIVP